MTAPPFVRIGTRAIALGSEVCQTLKLRKRGLDIPVETGEGLCQCGGTRRMGEFIVEVVDEDAASRDRQGADFLDVASLHLTDDRILHVQHRGQMLTEDAKNSSPVSVAYLR